MIDENQCKKVVGRCQAEEYTQKRDVLYVFTFDICSQVLIENRVIAFLFKLDNP